MKPTTLPKGTKAYSYLRFSSSAQAQGDSQRRQIELGRRWCQEHGIQLVESYADLGVSAYRGRNAAQGDLARFLGAVQSGKVTAGSLLIVESLDRLSRQTVRAALGQFLSIINAGVGIVTLADGKVYTPESCDENFTDLIISLTVMARANEESKTKALRAQEAWRAARARAATGKVMTSRCPAWLEPKADGSGFVVIEERAKVVREVFKLAAGGMGTRGIAKLLNQRGTPVFRTARWWDYTCIRYILTNRAVLGDYTPHTKAGGQWQTLEPIPKYFPAIIPLAVWSKVQTLRTTRPSYRGRASSNVFSHLLKDIHTGHSIVRINRRRNGVDNYYLVPSSAVAGKSEWKTWRYDDFLSSVLLAFEEAAKRRVAVKASADPIDELKGELADLDAKVARLVDFLAAGTMAGVDAKLRALDVERADLQAKLATAEAQRRVEPIQLQDIDWQDTEALRGNLRATVKTIFLDLNTKEFVVECLDGRRFGLARKGDKVTFTVPNKTK